MKWVTLKKASELTGQTVETLRMKIKEGRLPKGQIWIKAPDGRILIDMEVYPTWDEESYIRQRKQEQDDLLKSEDDIVKQSKAAQAVSGVYFLIDEGRVVYVGESGNVHARVACHIRDGGKDFTRIHIIPCNEAERRTLEKAYIKKFNPPLNVFWTSRYKKAV